MILRWFEILTFDFKVLKCDSDIDVLIYTVLLKI